MASRQPCSGQRPRQLQLRPQRCSATRTCRRWRRAWRQGSCSQQCWRPRSRPAAASKKTAARPIARERRYAWSLRWAPAARATPEAPAPYARRASQCGMSRAWPWPQAAARRANRWRRSSTSSRRSCARRQGPCTWRSQKSTARGRPSRRRADSRSGWRKWATPRKWRRACSAPTGWPVAAWCSGGSTALYASSAPPAPTRLA